MAGIGSVVINFLTNSRDAARDVDHLATAVGDVDKKARKTDGAMGKLGSTLKLGVAAGAALAGVGILKLGEFLLDAGKAAVEDQQSAEKLRKTLKTLKGVTDDTVDSTEDWIGQLQLATHVSDTDLRTALSKLALVLGSVDKAQRGAAAAADLAAVTGKSYTSVADAMSKAAAGNTTALKRLAPWLDANKDGTVTYSEALKVLETRHKDAAEAAADTDVWTTLKIIWDELKESLGQWLLPVLNKFSDWFKNPANKAQVQRFIEKVGEMAYALGEKLVPKIEELLLWFESGKWKVALIKLQIWAQQVKNNFMIIWNVIQAVIKAISTLLGALTRLPSGVAGLLPGGRSATPAAGPAASATTQTSAPPAYYREPTVIVTEEQVYRAIQRLIMRGDARNGRLVVAR